MEETPGGLFETKAEPPPARRIEAFALEPDRHRIERARELDDRCPRLGYAMADSSVRSDRFAWRATPQATRGQRPALLPGCTNASTGGIDRGIQQSRACATDLDGRSCDRAVVRRDASDRRIHVGAWSCQSRRQQQNSPW